MIKKFLSTNGGAVAPLFLRLALGVVFFAHGGQKMFGWFGGYGFHGTMGWFTNTMHIPAFFGFLTIVTEFFGGVFLLAGFVTRLSALAIGIEMIVAVKMVHLQNGFFMNWSGHQKGEGYEYHILVIAICIALLITGGGLLSVDSVLARKNK